MRNTNLPCVVAMSGETRTVHGPLQEGGGVANLLPFCRSSVSYSLPRECVQGQTSAAHQSCGQTVQFRTCTYLPYLRTPVGTGQTKKLFFLKGLVGISSTAFFDQRATKHAHYTHACVSFQNHLSTDRQDHNTHANLTHHHTHVCIITGQTERQDHTRVSITTPPRPPHPRPQRHRCVSFRHRQPEPPGHPKWMERKLWRYTQCFNRYLFMG